ncbi:uncharacterized protein LOC131320376 [Rhododendron vialii]|uniref:uncharacterized protein LOC131320376 n=1 Tax=Rhododendron vialii TaxID=182163 RepID=UPI00265E0700|nr:uncharacterized protein LOC131320376 [Rhododendron vialii]
MAKIDEANAVKLEKFSGEHFKRWQTQVRYWLTVLGLYSAIDDSESSQGSWMTKEQIEYHCYHRILSVLSDHLYDVYLTTTEKAKELWDLLEAEYGLDDAGVIRFAASSFNNYKMIDGKSIGDQIHEFKELLKGAKKSGTTFSEDFKVSCLIDKLPPSWSDFALSLRHKQGELTMTQTINTLRVEEKHRAVLVAKPEERTPRVNIVDTHNRNNNHSYHNRNNHHHRSHNSHRRNNLRPKGGNFKPNRFNQNRDQHQSQNQNQNQNQNH